MLSKVHLHSYEWIEEPGDQSRVLEWVRECECGYSPDRPQWRVIVTGSRKWTDKKRLWDALDAQLQIADWMGAPMVVVEGQCPHGGADAIAEEWAMANAGKGVYHDPFPANWTVLGKRAGPYRNQQMVDSGGNVCLGFPTIESRGTWDCLRRAEDAGIPTKVFE